MPPVTAPTNESQLEAASSISSQNTSPSFQPSEGPVSLTAEQVPLTKNTSHCIQTVSVSENGLSYFHVTLMHHCGLSSSV